MTTTDPGTSTAGPETPTSSRGRVLPTLELALALVLLTVGAVTSCVLAAAWLTMYLGPLPVPVSILAAGVWSLLLVRVAARWSDRPAVVAFPAFVWILTLVALNFGPGGDMPVPIGLRGLVLLVVGGLIPLWVALYGRPARHAHRG